jgi:hypothetical protein
MCRTTFGDQSGARQHRNGQHSQGKLAEDKNCQDHTGMKQEKEPYAKREASH